MTATVNYGKIQTRFTVNDQRARTLLPFALLTAVLAVSTASIFIRLAQQEAPSLVIATYRLTVASLILAPIALAHHRDELRSLQRKDWLMALLSGILLALHFATWVTSLEYTTVASSVVLVSTAPLWVALLSPLVLREPPTKTVLIGMLLALVGGAVIGLSDACAWKERLTCPPFNELFLGKAMWGNLLALIGAWTVTGYLLIGRRLRQNISLLTYIFLVYSMGAIVLLGIMFFAGQPPFGYTPLTYLWMILLALVPQLIGHTTYNWALRYTSASFVAVTILGEPVGSTILAYFILQETPGWLKVIGAGLILAGIWLASITKKT